MAIKVFELNSIEGRRFTKHGEKFANIRIDHNSSVTMVTEINNREASVDFRFVANYAGIGIIRIDGRLIYEGDASLLVKQWSTNGQMPENVASEIHTTIMSNCIPEAVVIARDLHLPPPIPLPQVNIQKKFGKPPSGQEVA